MGGRGVIQSYEGRSVTLPPLQLQIWHRPLCSVPEPVEVSRAGDELPGSSAQPFHLQDQTSEKAQDCKSGGDKL